MAPFIVKSSNFDSSKLVATPATKNKQGSLSVHLNYNSDNGTEKKISLQTPKMICPFGMSEFPTEYGPKYSIDVSFSEKNSDTSVEQFYDTLKSIDEFMIETAHQNSKEWFGKQMSKEVIEELYRPLVKPGKERKDNPEERYPDTVKFKIRTLQGRKNVEAYTEQKQPTNIDNLKAGSRIKCIVEFSPIWFVNKNFGLTLNLLQTVLSKPDKISGFSFDDSDDEFEEYESYD
tara:strand:+ start:202 stop:897 length:696 start_codon:yes stop_codon:yes gene_type:complete